jgi:ATP-binding cassette subfamily G (WHITE) protein 2
MNQMCEFIYRTIGPTGCGKSTLLDILANRKDRRGFSGNVFVSSQCRSSTFKSIIGYVVQDGKQSHKVNLL